MHLPVPNINDSSSCLQCRNSNNPIISRQTSHVALHPQCPVTHLHIDYRSCIAFRFGTTDGLLDGEGSIASLDRYTVCRSKVSPQEVV